MVGGRRRRKRERGKKEIKLLNIVQLRSDHEVLRASRKGQTLSQWILL